MNSPDAFADADPELSGPPPGDYSVAWWACGRFASDRSRVALIELMPDGEERPVTFSTIWTASGRLARHLRRLGVGSGDRVAIAGPQSVEAATSHIAVNRLGAIAVPLSILFGPDALRHRITDSEPKAVIYDGVLEEALLEALAMGGRRPHLVAWRETDHGGSEPFSEVVASGEESLEGPASGPEDPCLIIYTSGTSGRPKGALQPQRAVWGHLPAIRLAQNVEPGGPPPRFWTPADWAWLGGLVDGLLSAWHLGLPVVLNPAGRFDPQRAWEILSTGRITNAFIPPTALRMMSHADGPPNATMLRGLMTGGEALGPELHRLAGAQFRCPVNEVFGQTEMSCIVGNAEQIYPARPGSAGKAYPGAAIGILGDSGLLPPGELGEIAVRRNAPTMFLGYWNRPDETEAKFRGDWALTGDLGCLDEDGYLYVSGRKDDVIITAGYRVSPTEVEECISLHPEVALAAVVGLPDELRGQVLAAFVQPREGVKPSPRLADDIRELVSRRLAKYEYPRHIEFVSALPLTETGKIRRAALRENFAHRHGGR